MAPVRTKPLAVGGHWKGTSTQSCAEPKPTLAHVPLLGAVVSTEPHILAMKLPGVAQAESAHAVPEPHVLDTKYEPSKLLSAPLTPSRSGSRQMLEQGTSVHGLHEPVHLPASWVRYVPSVVRMLSQSLKPQVYEDVAMQ
jgi:hypothetical protein